METLASPTDGRPQARACFSVVDNKEAPRAAIFRGWRHSAFTRRVNTRPPLFFGPQPHPDPSTALPSAEAERFVHQERTTAHSAGCSFLDEVWRPPCQGWELALAAPLSSATRAPRSHAPSSAAVCARATRRRASSARFVVQHAPSPRIGLIGSSYPLSAQPTSF